jgi:VPDSG-CTERM motif
MNRTISSLKSVPLITATLAIAIMCGLSLRTAQAGYIVTLQQVGSNVVATGSGAIDLTGLAFDGTFIGTAQVNPSLATLDVASGSFDDYIVTSGPSSVGSGGQTLASSSSGDVVGVFGTTHEVFVPQGYVSGSALSDSSTYNSATFSSLGVTPGTYEWTWGTGVNQNFTLQVGVPDTGSTFGLLAVALAALVGASRLRSLRRPNENKLSHA